MKQMFAQVDDLFKIVQPFFIRAGVSEKRCKMPTGDINAIDGQKYIDAFDWLSGVLTSWEWEAVEKAWSLRTPKQWADYDLYEISGTQEQVILRSALNDFKLLWSERPTSFFGKHVNENEEDYENAGDTENQQPEI